MSEANKEPCQSFSANVSVAKTFLLSKLFPEALFFNADSPDVHIQTARFSEEVKRRLDLPMTLTVATWDELFALAENLVRSRTPPDGERFVFVWDEFQYLPERDPAFLPVFQRWWDSEDELDIVAVAENTLITCECKWTGSPMGRSELAELHRRTGKVMRALGGDFETEHYLFSKPSFKGLEDGKGLYLIDPERLVVLSMQN